MPDPADAADVAKKLTPAQKHAVLWLWGHGGPRDRSRGYDFPMLQVLNRLERMGLARQCASWDNKNWRPTKQGLAVRAHLQEEGGAP